MIKLSDAIVLGSMSGPQVFGRLSSTEAGNCAAGAGLGAVGMSDKVATEEFPWKWTMEGSHVCPECNVQVGSPYVVITHLNDKHRWTRTRIAGWVASVEPAAVEVETEQEELVAA